MMMEMEKPRREVRISKEKIKSRGKIFKKTLLAIFEVGWASKFKFCCGKK
jgi:hypothetical protein